jgi:hypothetical protein
MAKAYHDNRCHTSAELRSHSALPIDDEIQR